MRGALRRVAVVAAFVVVAGLVVAACTGSTSSGPRPIEIGSLVPVTALGVPQWLAGLRAAARDVNAHGGIHGRPVEIDNCDDHQDPNLAQACGRRLVSDGVIATAGNLTIFSMVEAPILDQAGIPQVGSEALNPEDTSLPTAFPLDGGIVTQTVGQMFGVKRRGLHSVFAVTLDVPSGKLAVQLAEQGARAAGLTFVGAAYAPPATQDFTPYVRQAVQSGADVVYPAILPPVLMRFMTATRQAGAHFLITDTYGEFYPQDIEQLGGSQGPTEGSVEFGTMPPVTATDHFPALRTFSADMDAELAAGDRAAAPAWRSAGPLLAWLDVQIIARVASTLPVVSAATVLRALRTSATVDTLGLTPPWRPGRSGPPPFPRITNPFGYFITQRNAAEVLADPTPFNTFHPQAPG